MLNNIFFKNFDDNYIRSVENIVRSITSKFDSELKIHKHDYACLVGKYYSLFKKDGSRIIESSLRRGLSGNATESVKNIDFDSHKRADVSFRRVVYLGPLFFHYGHFLLESTSRLWVLFNEDIVKQREHLTFVFHCKMASGNTPSFINEFLSFFNTFNIEIIDGRFNSKYLEMNEVLIPDAAFVADYSINKLYLKPFNFVKHQLKGDSKSCSKSCYLSRQELDINTRKIIGESAFIDILDKSVDVISPEKLSLTEQINKLSTYNSLTGVIGSAFHTILFLESKSITYFSESTFNINFVVVDFIMKNKSLYVNCISGVNENFITPLSTRLPKLLSIKLINQHLYLGAELSVKSVKVIDNLILKYYDITFSKSIDYFKSSPIIIQRFYYYLLTGDNIKAVESLLNSEQTFNGRLAKRYLSKIRISFSELNSIFRFFKNLKSNQQISKEKLEIINFISSELGKPNFVI